MVGWAGGVGGKYSGGCAARHAANCLMGKEKDGEGSSGSEVGKEKDGEGSSGQEVNHLADDTSNSAFSLALLIRV